MYGFKSRLRRDRNHNFLNSHTWCDTHSIIHVYCHPEHDHWDWLNKLLEFVQNQCKSNMFKYVYVGTKPYCLGARLQQDMFRGEHVLFYYLNRYLRRLSSADSYTYPDFVFIVGIVNTLTYIAITHHCRVVYKLKERKTTYLSRLLRKPLPNFILYYIVTKSFIYWCIYIYQNMFYGFMEYSWVPGKCGSINV